jgi:molecular chaperone DnaK (HSP70)
MSARYVVGIDLGTTHSVLAYAEIAAPAKPKVLALAQLTGAGEVSSAAPRAGCPIPASIVAAGSCRSGRRKTWRRFLPWRRPGKSSSI